MLFMASKKGRLTRVAHVNTDTLKSGASEKKKKAKDYFSVLGKLLQQAFLAVFLC